MRPPLLASATSLNFIAEVVNGLSLPTIVASLRVTVCAGAAPGWSSTAAVRNATKHFIGASMARVGTGARPILVLAIYPPVGIQSDSGASSALAGDATRLRSRRRHTDCRCDKSTIDTESLVDVQSCL